EYIRLENEAPTEALVDLSNGADEEAGTEADAAVNGASAEAEAEAETPDTDAGDVPSPQTETEV
ncbi:hypothetical protein LTR16_006940, partial [Cryomyces antarcticus]